MPRDEDGVCPTCGHYLALHGAVGPTRKDGQPYLDPCTCCDAQRAVDNRRD